MNSVCLNGVQYPVKTTEHLGVKGVLIVWHAHRIAGQRFGWFDAGARAVGRGLARVRDQGSFLSFSSRFIVGRSGCGWGGWVDFI